MKIGVLILSGCLLAGTAGAAEPGSIVGRIIVTRAMTKRRVSLPAYSLRGVSTGQVDADEAATHQKSRSNELSQVVVYLQGPGLPKGAPVTATLAQKDRRFDPDFVVVPVGSTVSFPNDDPVFHNVFSLSKTKKFDLGYYPRGETRKVKFDQPGVVQVYCHIHSDMSAAILVVPSAFWTRPSADGSFSFKNVPPGSYEIIAWHRSAGIFRYQTTVEARQRRVVQIEIPVREANAGAASTGAGSGR
ncbi:MAG TPA: hypothetical protein VFZ08_13040 [Terriglobia bacterium]|nr:hypothetical protein [Terriglobia bacterium]